jgi:DNA-binding transcriptional ArsR family regulator
VTATEPQAEQARINDPATMRALAHPARLELLEYLSLAQDGATATECAAVVGLSPSATSYHLRALAKVGMIEEAPGRGDGRERVWRASHRQFSVGSDPDAGPDELAAEIAMVEAFLARQNEKVRKFFARQQSEPREWYDLATITDQTLALTADELRELLARVDALVAPLRRRDRPQPPEGARSVSFQIRALPLAD